MNHIHSTAIVDSSVELDQVSIGPYCVIKGAVHIGRGTQLISHVYIEGDTHIGENNTIYPFSSIGASPQDLKYRQEPSRVRIGHHNQIRESVTIHRGTAGGIMETRIGHSCLLMAYSHVAHDCVLNDRVILANSAALAGHVEVGHDAILGGLSGVHQFCRVGEHAFLSGGTMITMDVPPFCIAEGRRAELVGINIEGLKRAHFNEERISKIKFVFREFFKSGRSRQESYDILAQDSSPDIQRFLEFVTHTNRGITHPGRGFSQ